MLVLSRKLGEKIYINDNICITVVDIDRGKIRLGIEAPRDVPVFSSRVTAAESHGGYDRTGPGCFAVTASWNRLLHWIQHAIPLHSAGLPFLGPASPAFHNCL